MSKDALLKDETWTYLQNNSNLLDTYLIVEGRKTGKPIDNPPEPSPEYKINFNFYQRIPVNELVRINDTARIAFKSLDNIVGKEDELAGKDDEIRSHTWSEAFKMAAYYYDSPTTGDRSRMQRDLDLNFSGIFSETKQPDETPDLRSNRHLVKWVCKKYNEYLEIKGSSSSLDCNYQRLFKLYGPNIDNVKKHISGTEFFM